MEALLQGHRLIYLGSLTGVFLILYWVLSRIINRNEDRRLNSVAEKSKFVAVERSTPVKHLTRNARKTALNSIDLRFSIIRKVLILALVLLWVIAFVYPIIGSLPQTMLTLLVTAGAVVIGIAARPYVENVISGIVITFSRQLNLGDTVVMEDNYGIVEDISITHTVIKLWDWRRHVIPNSAMIAKEFINYSLTDSYQWAYVEFWVSYDSDIELVRRLALETARENQYTHDEDEPRFWVMDMFKEGIRCWVTAWAHSPAEAWVMRTEIRTSLVMKLRENGIKTHLHHHSVNGKQDFRPGEFGPEGFGPGGGSGRNNPNPGGNPDTRGSAPGRYGGTGQSSPASTTESS
jgi:small-conductance mechanosensitive channel